MDDNRALFYHENQEVDNKSHNRSEAKTMLQEHKYLCGNRTSKRELHN